jgi:hypothetical protein
MNDDPTAIRVAVDALATLPFREIETVALQSANDASRGDVTQQPRGRAIGH